MGKENHTFLKIIIGISIAILLAALFLYLGVKQDDARTSQALSLIEQGQLEKGLVLCKTLRHQQYSDVCYITYIGVKINQREPWDKGLCDKITEKRQQEKVMIGCPG